MTRPPFRESAIAIAARAAIRQSHPRAREIERFAWAAKTLHTIAPALARLYPAPVQK